MDEEDLSLIVQAIMGQLSNEDLRKKTDINHDGKVDAADLVALTNLILYGKIVPKWARQAYHSFVSIRLSTGINTSIL